MSETGHRRLVAINPTGLVSGAEFVLLRLLATAQDSGWSTHVLAPDGPLSDQLAAQSVEYTRIHDLKLPSGPRAVGVARAAAQTMLATPTVRRSCADADVVLVNGLLALPVMRLARLRSPVVWLIHDIITRRDMHAIVRLCAPAIQLAISPSEAAARPARAHGVDVRVIHHGTPWPTEPARPDTSSPPIIGQAAILTSWKGQKVLLEAVAGLRQRDVTVELMGATFPKDQHYAAELRERAQRPDLDGRVNFLGHQLEPASQMRRWTISALPSTEPDAAPLAVIEAMSIGLPVITTDHGGSAEWLDGAGILVPPNDVDALRAAIQRMLDDDEFRDSCRAAGPARIAAGFTPRHNREAFISTLEGVVGGAHTR